MILWLKLHFCRQVRFYWGHSSFPFSLKQGSLMLITISSITGLLFLSLTSEIKPNLGDYLPTFVNHIQSHLFLKSDLTIELINFMLNPLKSQLFSGFPFFPDTPSMVSTLLPRLNTDPLPSQLPPAIRPFQSSRVIQPPSSSTRSPKSTGRSARPETAWTKRIGEFMPPLSSLYY